MSAPVGFLVKVFPKLSETFVLEEVLGLERLGMPLRLYTLAAPTDTIVHAAVAGVRSPVAQVPAGRLQDLPVFAWRHLRLALNHPRRYAASLRCAIGRGRAGLADFARAGWLAAQLHDDGVEHLHTHFISGPADVAELASRMGALPYSISAHAKDIYLSDASDLRRKMEAARFTVTCTDYNCRALRGIAPGAAVHRMYHGIDAEVFHPRRRAAPGRVPRLLSVGRLREKKGLDTLIDACRLLHGRGVAFHCEIVGYGEEARRLEDRIASHGLQAQVQLSGKLTRDQVIERYARTSIYVQPSRVAADGDRDGIPNVLLEAMAMALPVVATRVSGIPEVLTHRHNGLLCEPDDPAALADAIEQLIDAPDLGRELGRAARSTVTEHFDNDHNLQTVMGLLARTAHHTPQCSAA